MYRNFRRASIIAVALTVLVFSVALAAILDTAILQDGYKVDYLGYEQVGGDPDITKWTYAVTEPPAHPAGGGLSHWTLGVCTSFELLNPINQYTTITSIDECGSSGPYNCEVANYNVVWGKDGSTGVWGIKFEPVSTADQLTGRSPQRTHVFQFTISHPDGFQDNPGDVVVKTGNGGLIGAITGPQCPPTAVSLASFGASNGQSPLNYGLILMFAAGLLLLVGGGSYIFARRMA